MPTRRDRYSERDIAEFNQFLEALSYTQAQEYLVTESWPRFLYKFRPLETEKDLDRLRRIIVDSTLWLSSPKHFNDPFDIESTVRSQSAAAEKTRTL